MQREIICFVLLDQYADWEAAYLASALNMLAPGRYEIKTLSPDGAPVRSIGGFCALPDGGFASAPEDCRALILVGGMSWRTEAAGAVRPLAEDCVRRGALLGGICDAAGFLGAQGMLNGAKHTVNDPDDVRNWSGGRYAAKRYVRAQAVRDGNIVTANGTAALEFAREVLLGLNAAPERAIEEWYNFHKLGYCQAAMPQEI